MSELPQWDICERAFRFSCDIVKFCRTLSAQPGCRQIAEQLQDAGTSVGSNAAEAKAAYSRREFAAINCIALKESRETVFWLRLIIACGLTTDPEAQRLLKEAGELVGIFNQTVKSARRPASA